MSDLDRVIAELSATPILLMACDFDGTLAPFVVDPALAVPQEEAVAAVRRLAGLPHTHVAIVSGRGLEDLAAHFGDAHGIHLIGSHGAERERAELLDAEQREVLRVLARDAAERIAALPGVLLERKPHAVAIHYRGAAGDVAQEAAQVAERLGMGRPGVTTRHGSMVTELTVGAADKGAALSDLRHRVGATATIYLGDDVTDEDAFAALGRADVGVKVGEGLSKAAHRIDDVLGVSAFLGRLLAAREEWLSRRGVTPINAHSAISDERTMAIVTPDARVVWLCLPRIDSSSLFGALVGGPDAGFFSIEPAGGTAPTGQRYLPRTMVLETSWPGMTVTDYLDCDAGRAFQRAGRTDLIRVVQGSGRVLIRFQPRVDFGRIHTRLAARDGGLEVDGAPDPIVLFAPGVRWQISEDRNHQSAAAEVELGPEPIVLELRYGVANLRPHPRPEPARG